MPHPRDGHVTERKGRKKERPVFQVSCRYCKRKPLCKYFPMPHGRGTSAVATGWVWAFTGNVTGSYDRILI